MNIGIDLSPIQGPHRMRGIGYTLINLINQLPNNQRKEHKFIFFALPDNLSDFGNPLDILDLQGMDYEVRYIKPRRKFSRNLPGRLSLLVSTLNVLVELWDLSFGDSRIKNLGDVDVFLQTDQSQSLPHKRGMRKVLVAYDIIPYTLEWDYLWTYQTARETYGYSRKASFRCAVRRKLYALKLRLNIRRASLLLAISEATKQDFVANFKIKHDRIVVTPLGTSPPSQVSKAVKLRRYKKTSWGYSSYNFTLDTSVPFVLFVGGADKRRKLQDLVTAFNNLRAQGVKLNLVLAGDSMQGPETIATEEIQGALKTSSYLDDIIFLGFVDDSTRSWLYEKALAYVFPSRYEGFGLPVLEAFMHHCPVICYENSAVREVAGSAPLYVADSEELSDKIHFLLDSKSQDLEKIKAKGFKQAQKYDWAKTSARIFDLLLKVNK